MKVKDLAIVKCADLHIVNVDEQTVCTIKPDYLLTYLSTEELEQTVTAIYPNEGYPECLRVEVK